MNDSIKSISKALKIKNFNEILYCQAEGGYTMIHSKDGDLLYGRTLKYLESILPSDLFLRIHKSYLVNIKSIDIIESQTAILKTKVQLPISRRKRSKILRDISKKCLIIRADKTSI